MAGGESEHVFPVSTHRNTHIQNTYIHIDQSAQPETTALLQTHTNGTYGLTLFLSLAGQDEGQLVGVCTCTHEVQGGCLQQQGSDTQSAL